MIGPAELEDMKRDQAERLNELARRELAARNIIDTDLQRALVDAFFTALAQPAAIWLGQVRDAHKHARSQVHAWRMECERKNGPEP